jgi:ActR/RegA family two-component response regulator
MIDNGELNNLTNEECFVLGYEMASAVNNIKKGTKEYLIHSKNEKRIGKAIESFNIHYSRKYLDKNWINLMPLYIKGKIK